MQINKVSNNNRREIGDKNSTGQQIRDNQTLDDTDVAFIGICTGKYQEDKSFHQIR